MYNVKMSLAKENDAELACEKLRNTHKEIWFSCYFSIELSKKALIIYSETKVSVEVSFFVQ